MLNGVYLNAFKNQATMPKLKNIKSLKNMSKEAFAPTKQPSPDETLKQIDKMVPEEIRNKGWYKTLKTILFQSKIVKQEAGGGCN